MLGVAAMDTDALAHAGLLRACRSERAHLRAGVERRDLETPVGHGDRRASRATADVERRRSRGQRKALDPLESQRLPILMDQAVEAGRLIDRVPILCAIGALEVALEPPLMVRAQFAHLLSA